MTLIHINLCFYPTNWYVLIHINSCHKKEIESWRNLLPSWLLHCPLVVPPSCPAPSIAIALAVAPPIACRRHALHRRHAAANALCATAALLPPTRLCQAAATVTLSHCRHHCCRCCRTADKLPPMPRCCAATASAPPPSCC